MPTIVYDASQKLQNSLLQEFHQTLMRAYKISVGDGYPQQLLRLYSTMFHEWSALQKDVSDVMDAVSSLDWSVAPWVEAGQKPTDQAREVADVVSSALWQTTTQEPGTFAHSFLDMVGATLDGIYRGISVHEIIWQRDASLVYPAEYRQVQPQYYIWETREKHKDRLLMVPDGYNYTNPKPFPEDKFIIALNTTGSDHPIYNAVFYSLISFFMAAKHGLPWMQEFCQRYGHPSRVFHVLNDEDEAKLRAQLMSSPDVYDIFLKEGRSVEITPIPGAQGNPHEVLLRVAENACHQAILGQTLTSDTSANGGSLAQAEVHMGVQKSIVLKRAEYVARVLNRQLIPAIVRMNYGRTYGIPMPELKFAAPDDGANVQRADYWAKVLMIPGMQVAKEVVYESMRLPIPGDGEAVLSTPDTTGMQQQPMQDPFAFLKKNSESVAAANAEDDEEPEEDRPKQRRSLLNREALASTLSELFSESLLSRKEAEVEAAASDNDECRSKDPPHCRVHGTPLKEQEEETKEDSKEPEETKEKKESKETKESKESKEPGEPKGPKEPIVKNPKFVHIESPSRSWEHQKEVIAQKAKTHGIPGKGYVAPGMKEEFFLSNNAGSEMRWDKYVKKSADRISHYTASEHVDELWQVSYPLRKERDSYEKYPDSPIEWVHRRVAYMAIEGKKYEVLITAKEFKGKTPNILYQVQTWAIK